MTLKEFLEALEERDRPYGVYYFGREEDGSKTYRLHIPGKEYDYCSRYALAATCTDSGGIISSDSREEFGTLADLLEYLDKLD